MLAGSNGIEALSVNLLTTLAGLFVSMLFTSLYIYSSAEKSTKASGSVSVLTVASLGSPAVVDETVNVRDTLEVLAAADIVTSDGVALYPEPLTVIDPPKFNVGADRIVTGNGTTKLVFVVVLVYPPPSVDLVAVVEDPVPPPIL